MNLKEFIQALIEKKLNTKNMRYRVFNWSEDGSFLNIYKKYNDGSKDDGRECFEVDIDLGEPLDDFIELMEYLGIEKGEELWEKRL